MDKKALKFSSLLCLITFIFLIFWIVLLVLSYSDIDPNWDNIDYIKWVANPDIFFLLSYINATVFTILDVIIFTCLFIYLKNKNYKISALLGFVFIPIYGVFNLIAYSSQVTILPFIAQYYLSLPENSVFEFIVTQFMHTNDKSMIAFLNGWAYTILGIPSIIYGFLIIKINIFGKIAGIILIISGLFSFLGFIGGYINNDILSTGVLLSGMIFTFSILFLFFMFNKERKAE
ncbi:MAG: DUF4386 family protein [Spirochaetes bacterium]|nr:DUF4386 family protein [Spirochaetota bacterium]